MYIGYSRLRKSRQDFPVSRTVGLRFPGIKTPGARSESGIRYLRTVIDKDKELWTKPNK